MAARGRPRFMVLLDDHPDRVFGARGFDLPLFSQTRAREAIATWPDPQRSTAHLQGAEADRLKRVSGLSRAIPHVGFERNLELRLGSRTVELLHRPGPRPGSSWVVLPWARVVFVGDTLWAQEPPYLGEAQLEPWLESLAELRGSTFSRYKVVSSRDGVVRREAIVAMAAFLRKVANRMDRLQEREEGEEAAGRLAPQLIRGYRIPVARREQALLRLRTGLERLYGEQYAEA
jgi:glyoxylase-like metal-dependent hydrolase (beta-lactamase superfamily II)